MSCTPIDIWARDAAEAAGGSQHATTVGERLLADTVNLRALPAVALEPCEKQAARVSSTALVQCRLLDGHRTYLPANRLFCPSGTSSAGAGYCRRR